MGFMNITRVQKVKIIMFGLSILVPNHSSDGWWAVDPPDMGSQPQKQKDMIHLWHSDLGLKVSVQWHKSSHNSKMLVTKWYYASQCNTNAVIYVLYVYIIYTNIIYIHRFVITYYHYDWMMFWGPYPCPGPLWAREWWLTFFPAGSWATQVCNNPVHVQWIGWWENVNRKPSIFPWRSWHFPVKFPVKTNQLTCTTLVCGYLRSFLFSPLCSQDIESYAVSIWVCLSMVSGQPTSELCSVKSIFFWVMWVCRNARNHPPVITICMDCINIINHEELGW